MHAIAGKRVFITGGSRGLGAALAQHYAASGAKVGVCSRSGRAPQPPLADIHSYRCDVRHDLQLSHSLQAFTLGEPLNLFVVNAGLFHDYRIQKLGFMEAQRLVSTNLLGSLNSLWTAARYMRRSGGGRILLLVSAAALWSPSVFASSRGCLVRLYRSLRPVFAAYGIKLQVAVHGYINTKYMQQLYGTKLQQKPGLQDTTQVVRAIDKLITSNRFLAIFPWQMRLLTPAMKLRHGISELFHKGGSL